MNDKPDAAPEVTSATTVAPVAPTVLAASEPATAALGQDASAVTASHGPFTFILNITNSPTNNNTNTPTSSSETKLTTGGAATTPKLHIKILKSKPANEAGFTANTAQTSLAPVAPAPLATERVEAQPQTVQR